jgi:toluene monooxygenase system protein D
VAVIEVEEISSATDHDLVGPILRVGNLADAVIDAVAEDNPDSDVWVLDRDDYVRIHTQHHCRLTRASLERALGQLFDLAALEIDMPAFKGRMKNRTDAYEWFYNN